MRAQLSPKPEKVVTRAVTAVIMEKIPKSSVPRCRATMTLWKNTNGREAMAPAKE
jgi:hypothetical protein